MGGNRIYFPNQPVLPINNPGRPPVKPPPSANSKEPSFQQVLDKQITGVKFSQHALQRLESRNIKLNPAEMTKLTNAIEKAAQKGARESLILMNNDLALVVSVKNRTVITAVDGANMKESVFTNIDSAVIV